MKGRRLWLGAAVSAIFLALLLLRTDLEETGEALREANYGYVVPAIALSFVTLWLKSGRASLLLRPLAQTQSLTLFPFVTVGYMVNNLVPARAGEVVRAYLVGGRYEISRMAVLATIAIERVVDGIVLVGFLLVIGPLIGFNDTLRNLGVLMAALFGIAVVAFFAVAASEARSERFARKLTAKLPARFRGQVGDWSASFLTGLRGLRSAQTLALLVSMSLAVWTIEATAYYLVALGFDIDESWPLFLVVAGAANLAISVPSSQGGIGPFEFFTRETLAVAGVSVSTATAYAIALHAVMLLPVIAAGLAFVALTDITLSGTLGAARPGGPALPLETEPTVRRAKR